MEDREHSPERSVEDRPLLIELHDEEPEYDCNEYLILNGLVRNTYFQYVKKMLISNADKTDALVSNYDVNRYAQIIELNALKTCMSTTVYRSVMLKEINNIKCMTHSNVSFKEMNPLEPEKNIESIQNSEETPTVSQCGNSHNIIPFEFVNIKSEPMVVDDEAEVDDCLEARALVIKTEDSTADNVDSCLDVPDQENECMYDKIMQEMTEIFSSEQASSSKSDENVPTSPTSVIYSDRYFAHGDKHFWYLEYETHKFRYHQKLQSMYELNKHKYERVEKNIRDIIGSPEFTNSPLPMKKMTFICKDRINWHVKQSLSLYYKKRRFRSADEFRILAKNIVTCLIQIDPYLDYLYIYKAIAKVFEKKGTYVDNINQIQNIVTEVTKYVSEMLQNSI